MDDLIELLRQRCLEKPGVTIRSEDRDEFGILDGSLDMFVQLFLDEPTPVLMVRCGNALRKKLATRSSSVSVSDRMKWKTKGWKWTDVVLDGSIPPEVLLELIDHSYQLLHDELDDVERLRISMLCAGWGRRRSSRNGSRARAWRIAGPRSRRSCARPSCCARRSPTAPTCRRAGRRSGESPTCPRARPGRSIATASPSPSSPRSTSPSCPTAWIAAACPRRTPLVLLRLGMAGRGRRRPPSSPR